MEKVRLSFLGLALIALLVISVWTRGMGGWGMMDTNDVPMRNSGRANGPSGMMGTGAWKH